MWIYVVFSCVFAVCIFYFFIKIKFGFWAYQPVFHIYNLTYYFFPPGIINHKFPEKNKYTNFKNIKTKNVSELSIFKKQQITQFIQKNYLV